MPINSATNVWISKSIKAGSTLSIVQFSLCLIGSHLLTRLASIFVTDLITALLPSVLVARSSFCMQEKISIILLMTLGIFVSFICVPKYLYLEAWTDWSDYTWKGCYFIMWQVLEVEFAMIAVSLPALRAPLRLLVGMIQKSRGGWRAGSGREVSEIDRHSTGGKVHKRRFSRTPVSGSEDWNESDSGTAVNPSSSAGSRRYLPTLGS